MQKIMAIVFALFLAFPAVLAQERPMAGETTVTSSVVPVQQISKERAESIVRGWGVTVTSSQVNYYGDFATWDVYGYYTTNIGPSKVKMNVLVRLDASKGDFVSLEVKKQNGFDKEIVYNKLKELGISVNNMNYVSDHYRPYWEVYGTKYMEFGGFGFNIDLYLKVDARTGNIIEISQQPFYHIMGRTEPVYGGVTLGSVAEILPAISSAMPLPAVVVDNWDMITSNSASVIYPENEVIVDDGVEVA